MSAWGYLFLAVFAVLLLWIIDLDMDRYARKQARRRMQGKPYVNVPGSEKDVSERKRNTP
jgi:hypothetical protein